MSFRIISSIQTKLFQYKSKFSLYVLQYPKEDVK